jgi:hypothetical protein
MFPLLRSHLFRANVLYTTSSAVFTPLTDPHDGALPGRVLAKGLPRQFAFAGLLISVDICPLAKGRNAAFFRTRKESPSDYGGARSTGARTNRISNQPTCLVAKSPTADLLRAEAFTIFIVRQS